jgi:hypothetical protein
VVEKIKYFSHKRSILAAKAIFLMSLTGCTSTSSSVFLPPVVEGCVTDSINFDSRPEVLYQQMTQCIKDENTQQATVLYAEAGTMTWYYSLVESSEANRIRHNGLLAESLGALNKSQKSRLSTSLEQNLNNSDAKARLCAQIIIPLIQTTRNDAPIHQQFWDMAKEGYLHCNKQN